MAKQSVTKQSKKKIPAVNKVIAQNRKARHDYEIIETFESGLSLEGWEVKSLRSGRGQLKESYIIIRRQEAWLIGAHFTPLASASTHIKPDPVRNRKLLLQRRQLDKLIGAVQTKGMTLVALNLHWRGNYIKLELALVRGKKSHDKRSSEKDRDWQRQKMRIMSGVNKGRAG